ncbi:MAG: hypothetical protein HDR89_05495 [Bacteroides sp.]|nr:hypothetical protein [Bacteroides sp.]
MNWDIIVQLISVVFILIICLVWIVNRIRRRRRQTDCHDSASDSGCTDCPLANHCTKH